MCIEKTAIVRVLRSDSETVVVEAAGSISAYPGMSVRDFSAADPMGSAGSCSFAAAVAAAGEPVAEHIPETFVSRMGCKSLQNKVAVEKSLHKMSAESGLVQAVAESAGELAPAHREHRRDLLTRCWRGRCLARQKRVRWSQIL